MARIYPDGWETLETVHAKPLEAATLRRLGAELPDDHCVYHAVHWTCLDRGHSVYGEIDFIIVGPAGQVLLIEQKNGLLEETQNGLVKLYPNARKQVALQMQRSRESLQERFRHAHRNVRMSVDYLLFCPDHRVVSPATAGIAPDRIVDSATAAQFTARIKTIVASIPPIATVTADVVHDFLCDVLDLAPDPSALVGQARTLVTRISGGLATWARRLEFSPFQLRVIGTAGSGKTQLALRVLEDAETAGKRTLYVCFNRPLADHVRRLAPASALVATFHTLADQRARETGSAVDYRIHGAFDRLTSSFVAAEPRADEYVDVLIVDEGQDFEQPWADSLLRRLAPSGAAWWLEDPLQNLYLKGPVVLPGWTVLRAQTNYRTPRAILLDIGMFMSDATQVRAASPVTGDPIAMATYSDSDGLRRETVRAIDQALADGFKPADVVVLTSVGRERSQLMPFDQLGRHSMRRFEGTYDAAGKPIFTPGDVLLETVFRFKGQSAPVVILTEVDFTELDERVARLLYVAATRATIRFAIVMSETAARTCISRLR